MTYIILTYIKKCDILDLEKLTEISCSIYEGARPMGIWNVKYKENSTFHLDDCFESTVKEGSEDMKMKRIVSLAIATMLVLGSVNVVFADISEPMRIGENRQLNVPLDYQRTKYTCGPACMKMLLAKFGKSVSESQLAKEVHTQYNEVGTIVGNIPPVLNKYL